MNWMHVAKTEAAMAQRRFFFSASATALHPKKSPIRELASSITGMTELA
ncbi:MULTISPECIES: hypothetical protein [Bradyrhizobium]|jgi:hypothetical protein|nr:MULTISPECIES: hypothetical protein [Bradyrhizobium]MCS3560374.1 hypothetical protein [Bradyrhizobium elkanii]MCW2149783.1 hypothetical protein [Bradyrhizobium elkanii]MCW2373512.1 hypothetical protein [Bradyrhizobium elkanii]MDI2052461.1 hypothetical protein [Bradyrhizobium sp. Mp19]MDI2105414.1 hypothetical protein [Bradyrhizobium sp. Mp64]